MVIVKPQMYDKAKYFFLNDKLFRAIAYQYFIVQY